MTCRPGFPKLNGDSFCRSGGMLGAAVTPDGVGFGGFLSGRHAHPDSLRSQYSRRAIRGSLRSVLHLGEYHLAAQDGIPRTCNGPSPSYPWRDGRSTISAHRGIISRPSTERSSVETHRTPAGDSGLSLRSCVTPFDRHMQEDVRRRAVGGTRDESHQSLQFRMLPPEVSRPPPETRISTYY